MKKEKVAIIGAGPAGLTAAYYLLKNSNNYEVTIFELENQVGGISKTIEFNGYKIDTGIHRFFTKVDEIEQIWEELLPIQANPSYDDILLNKNKNYKENGSNPEKEDNSLLLKDRVTRIYYPVSLNFNTIKNLGFLRMVRAGFSYLLRVFKKLPETSLENFFINRFGYVLYSTFFESYTEKVWGRHPRDISADWGAQRVKGVSISEIIKDMIKKIFGKKSHETSLIDQFVYPKLGSGQMYEEMAKEIIKMGGKIKLNANVCELEIKNKKIIKLKYNYNKKVCEYCFDYIVSSMPIKNLINNFKGEKIPQKISNITDNLPYREFMSVGIVVDKMNLKNNTKIRTLNNIVPDSWIYVQEPDVKMGRIQIFNNWSCYMFKNKEDIKNKVMISFEYFCDENDKYWNMKDSEFIQFAIDEAIKIGVIAKDCNIEDSIRIKIPKAYPSYFGTYKDLNKVVDYLNRFENLFCIGRNGQHRYNNMDHSMLTGIETAKNIIDNKKNKDNIWNVNTEKVYHEKK